MKYFYFGEPDYREIIIETDKFKIHTNQQFNIIIGPNGCGKSYLLDAIEERFKNSIAPLGYSTEEIFEMYFAEYFPTKCGDGYQQIMKICEKLACGKDHICLKNPENFLHIAVQEVLIDVIVELFEDSGILVFIETQSPNILNRHFDFICEKEVIK